MTIWSQNDISCTENQDHGKIKAEVDSKIKLLKVWNFQTLQSLSVPRSDYVKQTDNRHIYYPCEFHMFFEIASIKNKKKSIMVTVNT